MWDEPTRVGNQQNLRGFGDAFAGRGADLNLALQQLVPLVQNAVPVLTNIASPETNFRRFFASQAQAAIITEPVAVQLGELWGNLSLTLAAFADVARPFLQDTITKGPSGQETFIEEAPDAPAVLPGDRRLLRGAAARHGRAGPARRRARERVRAGRQGPRGLARPEPPPERVPRRPRGLRARPDRADRLPGPDPDGEGARPADQPHHAGPDRLQLHLAVLPQRRQHPQRRRLERHLAAVHGDHHARRRRTAAPPRTARAARPRRPRTAAAARSTASTRTTCT